MKSARIATFAGGALVAALSFSGVAHAATAPDWGPPPGGGTDGCGLWVDPPVSVDVTVSDLTANGAPVPGYSDTRLYTDNPTHRVTFPLDGVDLPAGDVAVTFVASWPLSPQTATFSGTVHCSDVPPPTEPPTTTTTVAPPPEPQDHEPPPAPPAKPVANPCGGGTEQNGDAGSTGCNLPHTGDTPWPKLFAALGMIGVGYVAVRRSYRPMR